MSARTATTLAVGLLAGVSCLLTAYLLPIPIWVVFVAWASFFAAGGGAGGFARSLVMNLVGVVAATATLLVAALLGGSGWVVALCVVFGAGSLVAISGARILSFTPAGFFGFAASVGTAAATQTAFTDPVSLAHPALVAACALTVGAVFGIASETLAKLFARRPVADTAATR